MNKDKRFIFALAICTIICVIILTILMYSFVKVLVTGFWYDRIVYLVDKIFQRKDVKRITDFIGIFNWF